MAFLVATVRAVLNGVFKLSYPFNPADQSTAEQQAESEHWLHRSLVVFDQFINVLVLRGYPDETISAHAWRAGTKGKLWGKALTGWLELIESDHGQKAASGDLARAQVISAIEKQYLGNR